MPGRVGEAPVSMPCGAGTTKGVDAGDKHRHDASSAVSHLPRQLVSHVDVPDLDRVLPHNAADLDDDTHEVARLAQVRAVGAFAAARVGAFGGHPIARRRRRPM